MTDRNPASAARRFLRLWKRVSPRALLVTLSLAASAFLWPGLLQTEKLPSRAETVKVLGPAESADAGAPPARPGRHAFHPAARGFAAAAPNYGALRETPPDFQPPGYKLAVLDGPLSPLLEKAVALTPTSPAPVDTFTLPPSNGPEPFPGGTVG